MNANKKLLAMLMSASLPLSFANCQEYEPLHRIEQKVDDAGSLLCSSNNCQNSFEIKTGEEKIHYTEKSRIPTTLVVG